VIFFNLRGVVVLVLGSVTAWLAVAFLPIALSYQFFYGLLIAALASSLVALATDRCDRHGFWQGYRAAWMQFISFFGPAVPEDVGINSERRLAVFGGPLVFGPLLVLSIVLIVWVVDRFQADPFVNIYNLGIFTFASLVSVAVWALFAYLTSSVRTIQGSADFPDCPIAPIEIEPTVRAGVTANATPYSNTVRTPNRKAALMAMVLAAVGLAANHLLPDVRRNMLGLMIQFSCPLLLLMGAGSLIDPRIAMSIRAEGRDYPWYLRTIGILLTITSLAISAVLILSVYRLNR
jgi:hypothetical protein